MHHDHKFEFPQLEEIKQHFCKNKRYYIGAAGGAAFATFTCVIMRDAISRYISHAIGETAQHAIGELGESNVIQNVVTGKNNTLNSVSYISANRQGPPSWVVRCLETGNVFTSQNEAARAMDISIAHLSSHLNGARDNVNGYTFERICLAA